MQCSMRGVDELNSTLTNIDHCPVFIFCSACELGVEISLNMDTNGHICTMVRHKEQEVSNR